ncbi:hypothetical protein JI664_01815 [Rhodobacter sp. NTK016B]|uniref:hypothetical protein n=1 Tax=Rhodobacter sp. NTK016B TaxID=2759676 RepID=UPI001A8E14ED|nr:hypothetical protein [Rhodobacter sp. NTK016B]MBN8290690.1 hypothetical protein [Rhodobacter sp. NTK016B]
MTSSPSNAPILEPGEKTLAEFRPDRGKYWRDHGVMAVILMALAGIGLWIIDSPYPAIGSLGAILAVGVRATYLASETLSLRWVLTDRRVILPGGQRAVMLGEIAKVRPLLGDVQIVTSGGDKHLLKHLANGPAVVQRILEARDKRAKRRAD